MENLPEIPDPIEVSVEELLAMTLEIRALVYEEVHKGTIILTHSPEIDYAPAFQELLDMGLPQDELPRLNSADS